MHSLCATGKINAQEGVLMERVIRYLLAFMWFTWLFDHTSTVVGLNMGNFFFETNSLFDKGGWLLLIGYNFLLRCLITGVIIAIYKVRPKSLVMMVYIVFISFTATGTLYAATSNLSLIVELLRELGDIA